MKGVIMNDHFENTIKPGSIVGDYQVHIAAKVNRKGDTIWDCICPHGNHYYLKNSDILAKRVYSCKCNLPRNSRFKDLTDVKFGKLTVVEQYGFNEYGSSLWVCACDCGSEIDTILTSIDLTSGNTQSCGCIHRQQLIDRNTKHGGRYDRLYTIWSNMKARCYNPGDTGYINYGGRGITIDKRWKDNYPTFKQWAEKNGYTDELTIDRIDVNGNYTPQNCRWATPTEQSRNRRNNVRFKGWFRKELASKFAVKYHTVTTRVSRGWTLKEALLTPVGSSRGTNYNPVEIIKFDNLPSSIREPSEQVFGMLKAELTELFKINYSTFLWRLDQHWSLEEALLTPVGSDKGTNYNQEMINKFTELNQ